MELRNEATGFRLEQETGYFSNQGVNVIVFEDIYPEGHQGGVSLLMHGERIAANGDVRFEPAPGQWQPVPEQLDRRADPENGKISVRLRYPDTNRHLRGFNPMVYPDCRFEYTVSVRAEGPSLRITADPDPSLSAEWRKRLSFNRADASYIPGGVVSGTALIRPDFPELKEWPYLWQQTEYVLGGGSSRFMFLVLAVRDMMRHRPAEKTENRERYP